MKRAFLWAVVPLLLAGASSTAAAETVSAAQGQGQRPAPPRVTPGPPPRPTQGAPAGLPNPALAAWADAALSPGRWIYQRGQAGGSRALFGPPNTPSFLAACEPGRAISFTRRGLGSGTLTVRTSSTARSLPATRSQEGVRAQLTANDPLLDAIAFSRGRFAIEAQGAQPLIIPAWPELARVVEDCRR